MARKSEKKRPLSSQELDLRKTLSDGFAFVRGQETLRSLGALTLPELIDEQIILLDDREGDSKYQGYLQRLESLENRLLGDDGAIEAARNYLPDQAASDTPAGETVEEGL